LASRAKAKNRADAKKSFYEDEREVMGGRAKVIRTRQSGEVWQLRMWVSGEGKYLRESLKTTDLETAISRAETRYLQIYSDIKTGRKIFGITLGELVKAYISKRQEDVIAGLITKERVGTIHAHLKHLLSYKGANTKVGHLDRNSMFDYVVQRRREQNDVKDITIKNEQSTINAMMKFGYREGLSHIDSFEFQQFRKNEERRNTFELQEYDELIRFMRKWIAGKDINEIVLKERLMIRDMILCAANTMLRVGELWALKWGDILGYETHNEESGKKLLLVRIRVRAETSKVRKSRDITVRGGEYFKRLYERSSFKETHHLVFHAGDGKTEFSKRKIYAYWEELMKGIGVSYVERNITWYSLRHFGITCRLAAGASVFDVAKVAGSSSSNIDNHYGHFSQEMSRSMSLKSLVIHKDGIEER
jgi:integrase